MATLYNDQGYAFLRIGYLSGARRSFSRAASLDPDYTAAYCNLASIHVVLADYDQAVSYYRKALDVDCKFDLAYNGLGDVLIRQGEPERAISVLYTGLGVAQDNLARAVLWTTLGRAYLEAKRCHEAEDALVKALALDPEKAVVHCNLALAAEALEHSEDAIVSHWENCLRYADVNTPEGQELSTMARAHLQKLERGR